MIDSFRGEYSFLSNFYVFDGTSSEHWYQAAKATNVIDYMRILNADSPAKAKKIAKTIKIRQNWDKIKLIVMEEVLRRKFSRPDLAEMLLSTNPHELIERNVWGDTFWGICDGEGQNNLGKLLMTIRDSFLDNKITVNKPDFEDLISY